MAHLIMAKTTLYIHFAGALCALAAQVSVQWLHPPPMRSHESAQASHTSAHAVHTEACSLERRVMKSAEV
ncbi:MAG: hypothetical protein KBD36_02915 [Alphaproteobacteria bacterium]|nr:hypothetical protein [Alphaproteobacteria bacterium]MBP9776777.1 hypothetical protein [Alphaproteobacteria bacterium]